MVGVVVVSPQQVIVDEAAEVVAVGGKLDRQLVLDDGGADIALALPAGPAVFGPGALEGDVALEVVEVGLAGHELDDAAQGAAAIERPLRALEHLDLRDHRRIDFRHGAGAGRAIGDRADGGAVDLQARCGIDVIAGGEAAKDKAARTEFARKSQTGHQSAEVAHLDHAGRRQLLRLHRLHGARNSLEQFGAFVRRDHDLADVGRGALSGGGVRRLRETPGRRPHCEERRRPAGPPVSGGRAYRLKPIPQIRSAARRACRTSFTFPYVKFLQSFSPWASEYFPSLGDGVARATLKSLWMESFRKEKSMARSTPSLSQLRLGKAIRARRGELGMSLAALAGDLGLAVSSLSKLENGLTPITFERLERISRLLDVDMASLLADGPSRPRPAERKARLPDEGQPATVSAPAAPSRAPAGNRLSKVGSTRCSFTRRICSRSAFNP